MTELSPEARLALKRGLAGDGVDAQHRARLKRRVLASLAGTVSAASTSAGAATAAAAAGSVTAGSAAGAKLLGAGSLVLWFGMGAAGGIGVSGVVALASRLEQGPRGEVVSVPSVNRSETVVPPASASPSGGSMRPLPEPDPEVRAERAIARASAVQRPRTLAPAADLPSSLQLVPPAATSSGESASLREEAQLLQTAQRSLAAGDPAASLAALREHERRFAAGVLHEEREVAEILALCALGRVERARTLARSFVERRPRSLLIPRLEQSCAVTRR